MEPYEIDKRPNLNNSSTVKNDDVWLLCGKSSTLPATARDNCNSMVPVAGPLGAEYAIVGANQRRLPIRILHWFTSTRRGPNMPQAKRRALRSKSASHTSPKEHLHRYRADRYSTPRCSYPRRPRYRLRPCPGKRSRPPDLYLISTDVHTGIAGSGVAVNMQRSNASPVTATPASRAGEPVVM